MPSMFTWPFPFVLDGEQLLWDIVLKFKNLDSQAFVFLGIEGGREGAQYVYGYLLCFSPLACYTAYGWW